MRYSRIFSLCLGLAIAGLPWSLQPAQASCFECDEIVELNDSYAQCFLKNYETVLGKLGDESDSSKFLAINFAGCNGGEIDGDRGLWSMPNPDALSTDVEQLKPVYNLNRASVVCLKDQLDKLEGPIDPSVTIELYKVCNP